MSEQNVQEDFVMVDRQESKVEPMMDLRKIESVELGPGDILVITADTGKMRGKQIEVYFEKIADGMRKVLNTVGHNEVEIMVIPKTMNLSVLKMVENH